MFTNLFINSLCSRATLVRSQRVFSIEIRRLSSSQWSARFLGHSVHSTRPSFSSGLRLTRSRGGVVSLSSPGFVIALCAAHTRPPMAQTAMEPYQRVNYSPSPHAHLSFSFMFPLPFLIFTSSLPIAQETSSLALRYHPSRVLASRCSYVPRDAKIYFSKSAFPCTFHKPHKQADHTKKYRVLFESSKILAPLRFFLYFETYRKYFVTS